ncbi:MAG TPA: hypothetical protein VFA12_01425 [Stellaceae bacterium]|nr:hypothetical protein [Stellaceae bacterium]
MSYSVIYSDKSRAVENGEAYRLSNGTVIGWLLAFVMIGVTPLATTMYRDAYPAELQRREALDRCSLGDPTFVRFLAAQRDACYRRFFAAPSSSAAPPAPVQPGLATANFVDLWQAAGRGHQPANDVRSQAQTAAVAAVLRTTPR